MGVLRLTVQDRRFIIFLFVEKKTYKGKTLFCSLIKNTRISLGCGLTSSKPLLRANTSDPWVYKCLWAWAIIPEQSRAGEVLRLAEGMSKVRWLEYLILSTPGDFVEEDNAAHFCKLSPPHLNKSESASTLFKAGPIYDFSPSAHAKFIH